MLADDNAVCRHLLSGVLRCWEFPVVEVTDGEVAWHILSQEAGPWLAILDWQMPGLDGPEVCRRVRASSSSGLIYAILLTGRNAREDRLSGLRAGADDYITKPFDHEELRARLQVGVRVLSLQRKLADQVKALEDALGRVKTLHGLLPICCYCKSIRTDEDYWQQVEHYLMAHSELQFSHSICPRCYDNVIQPQLAAQRQGKSIPCGSLVPERSPTRSEG
jgi:CheY-like chemotaxis protein